MKALAALLLALCLSAHADPSERAQNAAIADVASTGAALALGAAEANPLGLLTLPMKFAAIRYAEGLPDGDKQTAQSVISSMWRGAAANNVCVIMSIVTGGTFAPVCAIAGFAVAWHEWQSGEIERQFWMVCAYEKQSNPELKCSFTTPT